jgi:tRNA G26 N,N-dimethylase Trm1
MAQSPPAITIPDGFTLHSENTAHIILPSSDEAFLNPVQEFNRDLSVACIRVWSEELNKTKESRWHTAQERRAKKGLNGQPLKKRSKRELQMYVRCGSLSYFRVVEDGMVPDTVQTKDAGTPDNIAQDPLTPASGCTKDIPEINKEVG